MGRLTDVNVVEDGLAVGAQVHASEEHDLFFVGNQFVTPARTGHVAIHCDCTPTIGKDIVDVEVIESDILDCLEDGVISSSINDELVFEEGG